MPTNPNNSGRTTSRKRNRQRGKVRANLAAPNRARLDSGLSVVVDQYGARQVKTVALPSGNVQRVLTDYVDTSIETAEGLARSLIGSSNREIPAGAFVVMVRITGSVKVCGNRVGCARLWSQWQSANPLAKCTRLTWHVQTNGLWSQYGMEALPLVNDDDSVTRYEYWQVDYSDSTALSLLASEPYIAESHLSRGERVALGTGAGDKPARSSGKGPKDKPARSGWTQEGWNEARKPSHSYPDDMECPYSFGGRYGTYFPVQSDGAGI